MNQDKTVFDNAIQPPVSKTENTIRSSALDVGQIGAFSALIALGTILSNYTFGIGLPPPLTEITLAPAFYMAIAVLFSRRVSFWSTLIGSGVGEAINIFVFGSVPGLFAITYVPGIVIARAPETLIIHRFRNRTVRVITLSMVMATCYEALAYFLIDWPVYSLTAFYQSTAGWVAGFWLASLDFLTLIDLVWIPVSLALIVAARRAFNRNFFD